MVTIATRSGSTVAGAVARVPDASDAAAFVEAAKDASTIFLCTNPPYTDWAAQWPPIYEAAIAAASATGARIVVMGNLYPYGSPTGAMTEHSPEMTTESKGLIRQAGWVKMCAAHKAGYIQAVEVRASDYLGLGVSSPAHLGKSFFTAVMRSKTARVVGKPQLLHSWSYLPDIVTTLIAAADNPNDWGRIWHVPSSAVTRTDIAGQINAHFGTQGKVSGYPQWRLRSIGVLHPLTFLAFRQAHPFASRNARKRNDL